MFETDPIFQDLYKNYLLDKISCFHTRFPMSLIQEGFYLEERSFKYVRDAPLEEVTQGEVLPI